MPDAPENYVAAEDRYAARPDGWFRRCGESGLMLPAVSLGCWHNFGDPGTDSLQSPDEAAMHANCRAMLFKAFDLGVTHFDLANNYGPAPGAAEERVGRVLRDDLAAYRDELIVSSKAGYLMWPGPYGDWGSRKYLVASCDQSLRRLKLDYVDLFYHHRPDPETPLEETLGALDAIVRQGKALYVGISNYSPGQTAEAIRVCEVNGFVKPVIHQPSYSMLNRWIEQGLTSVLHAHGMGSIVFSPLAGGQLTDKYLDGVPADSRAANEHSPFMTAERVDGTRERALRLRDIAKQRGQSLTQLALAWVLRDQPAGGAVTTALIGASRPSQIEQCAACLDAGPIDRETIDRIETILAG
ncbi:MAG: aldo/keto reductase [Planctomycetota bacterium]